MAMKWLQWTCITDINLAGAEMHPALSSRTNVISDRELSLTTWFLSVTIWANHLKPQFQQRYFGLQPFNYQVNWKKNRLGQQCRMDFTGSTCVCGMIKLNRLHREKYFWNPIKSNWNQIVFNIFQLSWNQTDIRLVPNQSKNNKCNLISVWFKRISKRFICVYACWPIVCLSALFKFYYMFIIRK